MPFEGNEPPPSILFKVLAVKNILPLKWVEQVHDRHILLGGELLQGVGPGPHLLVVQTFWRVTNQAFALGIVLVQTGRGEQERSGSPSPVCLDQFSLVGEIVFHRRPQGRIIDPKAGGHHDG